MGCFFLKILVKYWLLLDEPTLKLIRSYSLLPTNLHLFLFLPEMWYQHIYLAHDVPLNYAMHIRTSAIQLNLFLSSGIPLYYFIFDIKTLRKFLFLLWKKLFKKSARFPTIISHMWKMLHSCPWLILERNKIRFYAVYAKQSVRGIELWFELTCCSRERSRDTI